MNVSYWVAVALLTLALTCVALVARWLFTRHLIKRDEDGNAPIHVWVAPLPPGLAPPVGDRDVVAIEGGGEPQAVVRRARFGIGTRQDPFLGFAAFNAWVSRRDCRRPLIVNVLPGTYRVGGG